MIGYNSDGKEEGSETGAVVIWEDINGTVRKVFEGEKAGVKVDGGMQTAEENNGNVSVCCYGCR